MQKTKRTVNNLQSTPQKTKDWAANWGCTPEWFAVPVPHVKPVVYNKGNYDFRCDLFLLLKY